MLTPLQYTGDRLFNYSDQSRALQSLIAIAESRSMIAGIRLVRTLWWITGVILLTCQPSPAQERLCDPSFEDCYTPLLQAVQTETVGIDLAFYWTELPGLADAIISRHKAGVPVRVTVEPRASTKFPQNQLILDRLKAAGV